MILDRDDMFGSTPHTLWSLLSRVLAGDSFLLGL